MSPDLFVAIVSFFSTQPQFHSHLTLIGAMQGQILNIQEAIVWKIFKRFLSLLQTFD